MVKPGVFKQQNLVFTFNGIDHQFSFTPEQTDWWTSFRSHGQIFDVHYDENYDHMVVYQVVNGVPDTSQSIHTSKIFHE